MRSFIFSMMLAMAASSWAQECVIPMGVYISSNKLPDSSAKVLENHLTQAIVSDGVASNAFSLFSVVASVSEIQEEIISGVRPQYVKIISLDLSIGNVKTGEKFDAISIELRGAGATKERAYNSCFSQLQNRKSDVTRLLKTTRQKIIAYYDSQLQNIVAQSKSYCTQKQFEDALCLLASVPTCCNQYGLVANELEGVFQQYVNYDCAEKVLRARAIWAASQTTEAALMAGAYLSAISPSASCNGEAVALLAQIQSRMGEKWDLTKELLRGNMALESERIAAGRAIGVAYGNNQKANTYNDHWIVR